MWRENAALGNSGNKMVLSQVSRVGTDPIATQLSRIVGRLCGTGGGLAGRLIPIAHRID